MAFRQPASDHMVFRTLSLFLILAAVSGCGRDDSKSRGIEGQAAPLFTFAVPGVAPTFARSDQFLAVTSKNIGVDIFDISSPARPLHLGQVQSSQVYRVDLRGSVVMVLDEKSGLSFLDLRKKDALQLVPSRSSVEIDGYIQDTIWADHGLLLASETQGITAYLFSAPLELRKVGSTFLTTPAPAVTALSVSEAGLVAADYIGGLSIYSWPNESGPVYRASLATSHKIEDLACVDQICYASALEKGLFAYQVPGEGPPQEVGQLSLPQTITSLVGTADLIFAATFDLTGAYGFYVVDIASPAEPRLKQGVRTEYPVRQFLVIDTFVYVLLENGTIQIFAIEAFK